MVYIHLIEHPPLVRQDIGVKRKALHTCFQRFADLGFNTNCKRKYE